MSGTQLPIRHRKRRTTHRRRTLRMVLRGQPWDFWMLVTVFAACVAAVPVILAGAR